MSFLRTSMTVRHSLPSLLSSRATLASCHSCSSQRRGFAAVSAPESEQQGSGGVAKTLLGVVGLTAVGAGLCLASDDVRATGPYRYLVDNVGTPMMRMFDPETAHGLTIKLLQVGFGPVYRIPEARSVLTSERVFERSPGLSFASPLGLAAGFDKQCDAPGALVKMGFGFVELGGVPPGPQPGNPKPRMWRCPEEAAVINCFGLNSEGAAVVSAKLAAFQDKQTPAARKNGILGVNLAKNTTTPADKAGDDYAAGVRTFAPLADFVTVNVSCPNVKWQGSESETEDIVKQVLAENKKVHAGRSTPGPRCLIFLKLSPDLGVDSVQAFARLAAKYEIDGLVVGNTTSTRPTGTKETADFFSQKGGLSGRPLKAKALESVRVMYKETKGKVPIIGCGGLESGLDAYNMIRAGASLLQLYSAMVYQGPGVVAKINEELEVLLVRDGFKNVQDAVGVDSRK